MEAAQQGIDGPLADHQPRGSLQLLDEFESIAASVAQQEQDPHRQRALAQLGGPLLQLRLARSR